MEYLLFIFPSVIDAVKKATLFRNFNDMNNASVIDINALKIFRYLHYDGSIILSSIVVGVVVLLLTAYGFIYYLDLLKSKCEGPKRLLG